MKLIIHLKETFGSILANGSNGDVFRLEHIEPHWETSEQIILDFEGITSMTHSFANAFIGNLVESHPSDFRQKLRFVNCSPLVKTFIKGALQYAQRRMPA